MKKMKVLKYVSVLFVLLMTILISGQVYAKGSFSVSASSKSVDIGKTVTISIKVSDAAGKFTASSSNSSVVSVTSQPDFADNNTVTFTVKSKAAGTATISVSASDVTDYDENAVTGTKSVAITVKKPSTNTNSGGGGTTTPKPNTTKSSNANLTAIKVSEGELSPKFSKSIKSYTLNVAKDIEKIDITATKENSKATYKVSRK
jgi:hypothetical protein